MIKTKARTVVGKGKEEPARYPPRASDVCSSSIAIVVVVEPFWGAHAPMPNESNQFDWVGLGWGWGWVGGGIARVGGWVGGWVSWWSGGGWVGTTIDTSTQQSFVELGWVGLFITFSILNSERVRLIGECLPCRTHPRRNTNAWHGTAAIPIPKANRGGVSPGRGRPRGGRGLRNWRPGSVPCGGRSPGGGGCRDRHVSRGTRDTALFSYFMRFPPIPSASVFYRQARTCEAALWDCVSAQPVLVSCFFSCFFASCCIVVNPALRVFRARLARATEVLLAVSSC